MAYFSNGSEAMQYEAEYCDNCLNFKDLDDGRGTGCPVWDVHQLYNYDQCKDKNIATMLSILIPRRKDGFADECTMFNPIDGYCKGQMKMEFTDGKKV